LLRARHALSVLGLVAVTACGGRADLGDGPPPDDVPVGVTPGPLGVCENRVEYSNDPGGQTTLTARIGYDADGRWIRYRETSARGWLPLTVSRTWDARGLLVAQEEDLPRVAPRRRHARWDYDAANRPVRVVFVLDEDPPRTSVTEASYDDDGRLRETRRSTNGAIDEVRTVREPTPGVVEVASDVKGDGDVDAIWRWRYDGEWLVAIEHERAGVVELRERYVYADLALGELAEHTVDLDGDGAPESVDRWTWKDHRVVGATHENASLPTDFPQSETWEYDAQGRISARDWKLPSWSFRTTWRWSGDRLSGLERRNAATGDLVEAWSFTWGCASTRTIAPEGARIAPIVSWEWETTAIPFVLRRSPPSWEVW
jgi:hypothetical protein